MTPLQARDIAESVLWCVMRPAHVNIQELVIYPTDQAGVGPSYTFRPGK
jgi:NADP-dependent 3-hydroxy acid dehydrogenase YdfG